MEYKIKDICNTFNFGVSRFYRLKKILDNSIPEKNRIEYYYNKGRNFYITEKGFNWFKDNSNDKTNISPELNNCDVTFYQNQIIEMYKKENEYLRQENKRLLDIISFKEQKELTKDIKYIDSNDKASFFNKFFNIFKK